MKNVCVQIQMPPDIIYYDGFLIFSKKSPYENVTKLKTRPRNTHSLTHFYYCAVVCTREYLCLGYIIICLFEVSFLFFFLVSFFYNNLKWLYFVLFYYHLEVLYFLVMWLPLRPRASLTLLIKWHLLWTTYLGITDDSVL